MLKNLLCSLALIAYVSVSSNAEETTAKPEEIKSKLIFVLAVWSHGELERPTINVTDENTWLLKPSELSKKGMGMQFKLGQLLAEQYIGEGKLLKGIYDRNEVFVRSTDWDYTMTSAMSNLFGFYSDYSQIEIESLREWPSNVALIPIHTLPHKSDHLGNIDPYERSCPRESKLLKLAKEAPEYKDLTKEIEKFAKDLKKNGTLNIENFEAWAKYVLPEENYNETITENIKKFENRLRRWKYGLDMKAYQNVNLSLEYQRVQGGPLLWHFIDEMNERIKCDKELDKQLAAKKSATLECVSQNKYYAYSGHASTIAALSLALGTSKTNVVDDEEPADATAITLELWKTNASYSVKVLFWRYSETKSTVSPREKTRLFEIVTKTVTKYVSGCNGTDACPMDTFVTRSQTYKPESNIEKFCESKKFAKAGSMALTSSFSLLIGLCALAVFLSNSTSRLFN